MTLVKTLREKIDSIDKDLLHLINQRAQYAMTIADLRLTEQASNFSPDRESYIFKNLRNCNPGPLSESAVSNVFSEIISVCRSIRKPLKVAYLGPKGTFSHSVALKRFGRASIFVPQVSIEDIFHEVENSSVDVGITPVENSLEGSVAETLDQLIESDVNICGEVFFRIKHCLLSKEERLFDIVKVYSHPQAFGQCRKWLRKNLPSASLIPESSTSAAIRRVMTESHAAAIGNQYGAEEHNLPVLAAEIQDSPRNTTRFLLIGNQQSVRTGNDKTSMIFAAKHAPGALYRCLGHFAQRDLNLTKIESRPCKNHKWEYYFFVDVIGHQNDPQMMQAIENLRSDATFLKVLGSYPIE